MPECAIPGLREGQGGREGERKGAIRHSRGAHDTGVHGKLHSSVDCSGVWHLNANSHRQIMGKKTTTFDSSANGSAGQSKLSRIKLTDKEKKLLQEKIKKATSLQEIIALEKELNEGRLPSGIHADAMEE